MHNALLSAEKLGFDCVQVFTKNQQQWQAKPLGDEAIECWTRECRRLKFRQTVSHDSYLINLASPDDALRNRSIDAFADELLRCEQLAIPYLVSHPGAHLGAGEDAGLTRVAKALDAVHARVPGAKVLTCIESTAGQGTSLGYRLEHLQAILEQVKQPERVAVCLDTAHLFAAGYDFRGRKYDAFRKELSRRIGLKRVKVWHLNDSKKDLGSRIDRHEHIGRGTIGLEGFRPIVNDTAWSKTPKILETPKETDDAGREWDAVNLEVLRGLVR
jgi:deoxyribonuclease-4